MTTDNDGGICLDCKADPRGYCEPHNRRADVTAPSEDEITIERLKARVGELTARAQQAEAVLIALADFTPDGKGKFSRSKACGWCWCGGSIKHSLTCKRAQMVAIRASKGAPITNAQPGAAAGESPASGARRDRPVTESITGGGR